ncbi:MAG: hypothetical protein M3451_10300 [Chloroflexota bacterium]|jgi:hypothetical protein|nr:hypothetical protein [Chloroflexota bacterium]
MASTDTMSTVYVAKRNGQCQHCRHRFYSSEPNPAPLCYHCKSAGRTVETAAPIFETYDDYSAWFADDLRDAAMEHELDDCEVAS